MHTGSNRSKLYTCYLHTINSPTLALSLSRSLSLSHTHTQTHTQTHTRTQHKHHTQIEKLLAAEARNSPDIIALQARLGFPIRRPQVTTYFDLDSYVRLCVRAHILCSTLTDCMCVCVFARTQLTAWPARDTDGEGDSRTVQYNFLTDRLAHGR